MAKKRGKTGIKVGIKKPDPVKAKVEKKTPPGKPPKRIRMLMNLARHDAVFSMGSVYTVPHQVPVDTARSWIGSGAAEEDKSLPGVPEETK